MKKIGFIGIGSMGLPMAERLINAGYALVVYDNNPRAIEQIVALGAESSNSPQDVADKVETVFLSLPVPSIVKEVVVGVNGVLKGTSVKTIIDLSTTGPAMSKEIASTVVESGKAWLDSPVSGGVKGAKKGTLAIMVSGNREAFSNLEVTLASLGKVFYVGDTIGAAQVVKLGNNMMAAAAMVVASEALAMGVKAGVDPKIMNDIINVSSGRNSATEDKIPGHVLNGTFNYGFSTGLSYKDVKLCVNESEALGVPMVAGSMVRQVLAITNSKYGPDSCFTSIAKVIEDWADCEIRSKS